MLSYKRAQRSNVCRTSQWWEAHGRSDVMALDTRDHEYAEEYDQ